MNSLDIQPSPTNDQITVPVSGTAPAQVDAGRSSLFAPANSAGLDDAVIGAKILIVDDELVNIKAVSKHLRTQGYENLTHVTDSRTAIETIRREQPRLILLDIVMPHIDGLELLRAIRADRKLWMLPVIILTAYSDADTKRDALEAGATDFLAKPIEPLELIARVRNILLVKIHQDILAQRAADLQEEVRRQAEALVAARHDADRRYRAGKAEIAVDLLHNVGNALNSVNLGVALTVQRMHGSRVHTLKKAVELLEQNQDDWATFFTEDKRGRVLPSYLIELANTLVREQSETVEEMELVTKHLEHINAVVATQHRNATLRHVTEYVSLGDLVDDVEEILRGLLVQRNVRLVRDFQEVPSIKTDRQKLMQVLVNVVKNGLQSIAHANLDRPGQVDIRVGHRGSERVFIEVRDNGAGIAPEDKVKVFSHGFTTKREGHGLGLHSCANLLKELGGAIQLDSDGPGKGATLTMELPLESRR